MKLLIQATCIITALALAGCGGEKATPVTNSISSEVKLEPFTDINNPSTLDLNELPSDIPRVVDLKKYMTSVKQQDDRGMCTFFTLIALTEAAIKKKMNVEVNLSEEYLNYAIKSSGVHSQSEGSNSGNNIKAMEKGDIGFLLEREWPYQPSWFGGKTPCVEFDSNDSAAPASCFSHDAPSKSVIAKSIPLSHFSLYNFDIESTNQFIVNLAKHQQPLAILLIMNRNGWADDGTTSYSEEMRMNCIKGTDQCGAHEVVLTGYDLDKKIFFFKNSWGKEWGAGGYGTLSFDYVDRHVDKVISLVDLDKDIELPKNHSESNFDLKKFIVKSKKVSDSSVDVDTAVEIVTGGLHTLMQTTRLVKIPVASYYKPNDENSIIIEPTIEESEKYGLDGLGQQQIVHADRSKAVVKWEEEGLMTLKIPKTHFEIPSVENLFESKEEKLLLRTSLYIYSDDEGYKFIKRYYHPVNFK